MRHFLFASILVLLSGMLTAQYYIVRTPAGPAAQTICSATWQASPSTPLSEIHFADSDGVLYPSEALLDTGAAITLVALCILEQLEDQGLAQRTNVMGGYGNASGTRTEAAAWEVRLVLYPFAVKTRVLEHYNNVAPVILGRDVLGSTSASVAVPDSGRLLLVLPE